MKAKEIEVGQEYVAKVSGNLVPVKVLKIVDGYDLAGRSRIQYRCRNKRTGREILVRSPQRFRCRACVVWGPTASRVRAETRSLFVRRG